MKTQHTPGPWTAVQQYANRWNIETQPVNHVPAGIAIVCTTVLEVGSNDKDTEANARLIAAAPDMLEALLSIENDDGRIPKTIWDMRNAAIAKATGTETV